LTVQLRSSPSPATERELYSTAATPGKNSEAVSLGDAIALFSRVRDLRAVNPEYLHRCARCFLKSFCEQCPAKSWTENGTPDTPVEYLCEVAHAQACYLGWLGESERGWEVMDWRERVHC